MIKFAEGVNVRSEIIEQAHCSNNAALHPACSSKETREHVLLCDANESLRGNSNEKMKKEVSEH